MQSFDVRFCKEYAVVYLIKIYLLIPKILHLNCKAIILKIIVKKKTPKNREKIAIIERESERIRDRDSCWIYNSANLFLFACSVHVSTSAISSRQYLSKQNKIVSVKFHFCMTSIRKDSSRVHVIFERLIYSPS